MADLHPDTVAPPGRSGDEPESNKSSQTIRADSQTPPKSSTPVNNKKDKSPASKKRALTSTQDAERAVKKTKRPDSVEEGEASSAPTSPPSLRSASMSESASDGSPTGGKSQALRFPVDGKFASEAEKAEIMALPEVKREQILADRAHMIERERQNRMLIQLLKQKGTQDTKDTKDNKDTKATKDTKETKETKGTANSTPDKKKRKAPAADLEENQRKSTRQKTTLGGRKVGETSAPLEEYKRQREQREAQIEQKKKEDATKAKTQKKVDPIIDADAEGESEDDWDDRKRRQTVKKTTPTRAPAAKAPTPPKQVSAPIVRQEQPAELEDFNHARFGKTGFGKFCFHPGFEEAITGCIVRLATGTEKGTGQNEYTVGQIKRFIEGKPYALEGPSGSRFVTTQYLIATQGKKEQDFPFIFCSDSKLTQSELDRFKRRCNSDSVPLPTKSFLNKKIDDINAFIHRKMTNEELNEKLRRSGAQARRMAPIIRAQIRTKRESAIARGDEATIAKCDAELADLNGPKLAFGTKLYDDPPEKKEPDIQDRVAYINQRNRHLNSVEIRAAQQREREARRIREEKVARGEAEPDPFARVKTKIKFMHDAYEHVPRPKSIKVKDDLDDLFEDSEEESGAMTPPTEEPTPEAKKVEAVEAVEAAPVKHGLDSFDWKPYHTVWAPEPTFEDIIAAQDSGLDSDLELP